LSEHNEAYQTHHEEYLERQKEIVKEELQDFHADQILDFLYDRKGDLAPSTARNYARELRYLIKQSYSSDRYPEDPEEWETADWEKLIRRVSRERQISDGTKRNTCYAARAFVDWSPDSPASKEDISAPKIEHSKIDEETVLKPDEVVTLIETTHNERDAAIISIMYEAALRRTALVQLDIKHYKTDKFARIRLPHKVGVKTGHGRERPLNWSAGFLDRWLNQHPDPENPDAPLFCSIREGRDEGRRLSSHAIYTMMERLSKKVDIEDDRIHPHALRHARATAMRKSDRLDKADIETVMGWTDSTPMHARYSHTTSTEDAERAAARMGIDIETDDGENKITDCPRCGTTLPSKGRFCPTCTLRISEDPPEWWAKFKEYCEQADELRPVEESLLNKYEGLGAAVPLMDDLDAMDKVIAANAGQTYEERLNMPEEAGDMTPEERAEEYAADFYDNDE